MNELFAPDLFAEYKSLLGSSHIPETADNYKEAIDDAGRLTRQAKDMDQVVLFNCNLICAFAYQNLIHFIFMDLLPWKRVSIINLVSSL